MYKEMYSEEELEEQMKKVECFHSKCLFVSSGRPYEYEHNHFKLIEELAYYLIMKNRNKILP